MSYSYSYKSSSGSGGAPSGSSSSYRYSGTSSDGLPTSSNPMMDAEFQAAKMQARMPMAGRESGSYSYKSSSSGTAGEGRPLDCDLAKMKAEMLGGAPVNRGNSSYSYQSSSTGGSSLAPNFIPDSSTGGTTVKKVVTTTTTKQQAPTSMERDFQQMGFAGQHNIDADFEAAKLRAGIVEGAHTDTGNSYSSYSSRNSEGALHPVSSHGSTGGSSLKKVTTTTTSRVNPAAKIQAELIERDLNRIGRLPDNYEDDFEKLKNQVLSGEAYEGEVTAQPQTHQRVREELMRTKQSLDARGKSSNFQPIPVHTGSIDSGITEETTTTTTKTYNSGMPGKEEVITTSRSTNSETDPSMYKSELYIPIKRHNDTFDDFHMHRWREHSGSLMDHELDARRLDWESRLNGIRKDFFPFSPSLDAGMHGTIDKSRTISQRTPSFRQLSINNSKPARLPRRSRSLRSTRSYYVDCTRGTNPAGRPEFSIQFEVRDFKPEEINLSTKMGKLYVTASHEEKIGNSTSRREFKRTVDLPADVQVSLMRSVLSKDGILSITAPINAPAYQKSSHITQQHATALNTTTSDSTNKSSSSLVQRGADAHDALNYNMSVAGYKPSEVHVTVEGRKVKVHAKHDESAGNRKVHNEMTKMFDLPSTVDPHHVRSYIKDGHTLYIEAHLKDDLGGKIHVLPVHHKY